MAQAISGKMIRCSVCSALEFFQLSRLSCVQELEQVRGENKVPGAGARPGWDSDKTKIPPAKLFAKVLQAELAQGRQAVSRAR